jgi:hypothetical protein
MKHYTKIILTLTTLSITSCNQEKTNSKAEKNLPQKETTATPANNDVITYEIVVEETERTSSTTMTNEVVRKESKPVSEAVKRAFENLSEEDKERIPTIQLDPSNKTQQKEDKKKP